MSEYKIKIGAQGGKGRKTSQKVIKLFCDVDGTIDEMLSVFGNYKEIDSYIYKIYGREYNSPEACKVRGAFRRLGSLMDSLPLQTDEMELAIEKSDESPEHKAAFVTEVRKVMALLDSFRTLEKETGAQLDIVFLSNNATGSSMKNSARFELLNYLLYLFTSLNLLTYLPHML